jgi:hypothetical protein
MLSVGVWEEKMERQIIMLLTIAALTSLLDVIFFEDRNYNCSFGAHTHT